MCNVNLPQTSNNKDDNLFALPQSSRASQRRRLAQSNTPDVANCPVSETAMVPGANLPAQTDTAAVPCDSAVCPADSASKATTQHIRQETSGSNEQGFISKVSCCYF